MGTSQLPMSKQSAGNTNIKPSSLGGISKSGYVVPDYDAPTGPSFTKNIRFLDDEYPTLYSDASSREQKCSNQSTDTANITGHSRKVVDRNIFSYDSEARTISETESASEWETDDEELTTKYDEDLDIENELKILNSQFEDIGLNVGASDIKYVSESNSHPKSILRRREGGSEPEVTETCK